MDFDLSADQKEIRDVARELLAARSPWAKVREAAEAREYGDALWRELCELGWPGVAVAGGHGGQGPRAGELAVLLEALGYACAATPFLSTAVAASVIQACGSDEQRARWLPGLATGETTAGVGSRELCADGAGAAVLVLLDGDHAELVEGAEAEPLDVIDSTRRYAAVRGGEGEPLGPGAADRVRAAVAAEVVGVCQQALDMTLVYVKDRKQFGVPVGSFQAVAHRCAQMLLSTETARSTAYFAAWAADADRERLGEAAALAGAAAADAGREVTAGAIQARGGLGSTGEAAAPCLNRRARRAGARGAAARRHRAALARIAAARVGVTA